MGFRTERDSMGEVQLPAEALYQAQTQRALDNFQISHLTMPSAFIKAVLRVKQAAAAANLELKLLEPQIASAIHKATEQQLLELDMAHYPIDLFQTGSGTSTNMNVNEVLATLASKSSGLAISPNDHINLGQSSNDVIPTAIHLSAAVAESSVD